jgi:hypothetical protein
MRSLKKFIAESVHTYDYTIKVAGDVDKNFLELFKYNLDKFSPVDIKGPTSTPIQKDPYGFPNLNNEPVHILHVSLHILVLNQWFNRWLSY